jgi:hypothetical protein
MSDPESPGDRSTPLEDLGDPKIWRLSVIQRFCEYDGALLDFLASGPTGFPGHTGRWLITWRSGGRLSASPSTPPELAGVERWLAIPLSSIRERQIVEGHVSLREAIAFSEAGRLFELTGGNPLAPERVSRVEFSQLPANFLPTADLTIEGKPMPELGPPAGVRALEVRIHIVPDHPAPESPNLADTGVVQGALQRFLGWAAALAHIPSAGTKMAGPLRGAGPPQWSALSLSRAAPGTLLLITEARIEGAGHRAALIAALERLKLTPQGGDESRKRESHEVGSPDDDGSELATSALVALGDVLRSTHLSLSMRWRNGERMDCALIGPPAAESFEQLRGGEEERRLSLVQVGGAAIQVVLTSEDAKLLRLSLDPSGGGLQKLIATLRDQLQPHGEGRFVLQLSSDQVEKVIRYVQEYGQGGYQDRLRPVYDALYRVGVAFVGLK